MSLKATGSGNYESPCTSTSRLWRVWKSVYDLDLIKIGLQHYMALVLDPDFNTMQQSHGLFAIAKLLVYLLLVAIHDLLPVNWQHVFETVNVLPTVKCKPVFAESMAWLKILAMSRHSSQPAPLALAHFSYSLFSVAGMCGLYSMKYFFKSSYVMSARLLPVEPVKSYHV